MRARTAIGVAVSAAALATVLWFVDWATLEKAASRLTLADLALASLFAIASNLLIAWRWATLAALPKQPLRIRVALNTLTSGFFNLFTPTALGADVYRVATGAQTGVRAQSIGLVMIERLLGLTGFAAAYLTALGMSDQPPLFARISWVFILVMAGGLGILGGAGLLFRHLEWFKRRGLRDEWMPDIVKEAGLAFAQLSMTRFAGAVLISFAGLAFWIAIVALIGRSVGLTVDIAVLVMIVVATELARLIPISAQGIGVREAAFAWFATRAGGAAEPAFVTCAISYALNFAWVGILAVMAKTLDHFLFSDETVNGVGPSSKPHRN
jgi:glycosyltransferase 2 family protein